MDTIAAIATAAGTGALGVLRVSGSAARRIASELLSLSSLEPRRAALAEARFEGETIDQVVATFFPGPDSATGDDLLEISAHGSPYILRRLLNAALALGARAAEPGEFTQRAFLNGKLDLAQAEAVCALIGARTQRAHRIALSQLEGGLSSAVKSAKEPVLDLLVRIEASLDHPEEDLPGLSAEAAGAAVKKALSPITALAGTFTAGRLASEGARICIVGRPNAGKSSLLNALLGSDRAIVCAEPGTTRDTLEEPSSLMGLPALLIDTAGLRENVQDPAERSGIERSERALKAADLALLVMDRSRPAGEEDFRVHRRILETAARMGRPVLTVANKADLPAALAQAADVEISATERRGIGELVAIIAKTLACDQALGEPVMVISARHERALNCAAESLREAEGALEKFPGRWEDRVASHLRQSLGHLDEILGSNAPDEVLRGIFSRFCIGK